MSGKNDPLATLGSLGMSALSQVGAAAAAVGGAASGVVAAGAKAFSGVSLGAAPLISSEKRAPPPLHATPTS